MHFLFNTSTYKPAYKEGGPIHSVSSLAEELVKRGHHVTVMAPNLDLGEKMDIDTEKLHCINGVDVKFFDTSPSLMQRSRLPYLSKARTYRIDKSFIPWLESIGPSVDVFDSHITYLPANHSISRYAKKHKKVYFYHQRGNLDPIRLRIGLLKKYVFLYFREIPIMKRADVLIGLTPYEEMSFRRLIPNARTVCIPNGISFNEVSEDNVEVCSSIATLTELFGNKPVFYWMSRIHETKGAKIFVEAVIQAMENGNDFHAVISGPDELGLEKSLKNIVNQAELGNFIHFTGPVKGAEKLALLNRSDVFVLPTISEGFSMVLLEALFCRCAVLTTSGAYFDEIESAGAGSIINRDVDAFAQAIQDCCRLGRKALAAKGKMGRALVEDKYTWNKIGDAYFGLAEELVNSK